MLGRSRNGKEIYNKNYNDRHTAHKINVALSPV